MKNKFILKKNEDFKKVLNNQKAVGSKYFTVFVSDKIEIKDGLFNIGFSVSKKKFRTAVERNYYKRVLKHITRENKNLFKKEIAYVVLVKDTIKEEGVSFIDIKKDYQYVISKLNKKYFQNLEGYRE